MYSRNLNIESAASGIKLNPDSRVEKSRGQQENIQIKSFTDNFAYDRFNRMGTSAERIIEERYPQAYSDQNNKNRIESENMEKNESISSNVKSNVEIVEGENHQSIDGVLKKLKNIFDTDTVIILLAFAILFFSENATNDKLTPFALLAILFF